jgi:prepilin-type N-terminal cleavage/methylation domain-containing protein
MLLLTKKPKKRSKRGLMLVEVLVVVAIMAIISTVVAFAAIQIYVDHQKKIARQSVSSLRHLAGTWRMGHSGEDCPDFARLTADKIVDRESSSHDPWGSPYVIRCVDDDITVLSAGPDKKVGTEDDIIAPTGAVVTHEL